MKAPSIPRLTGFSQDYRRVVFFLVRSMKIFLTGVRSSNDQLPQVTSFQPKMIQSPPCSQGGLWGLFKPQLL